MGGGGKKKGRVKRQQGKRSVQKNRRREQEVEVNTISKVLKKRSRISQHFRILGRRRGIFEKHRSYRGLNFAREKEASAYLRSLATPTLLHFPRAHLTSESCLGGQTRREIMGYGESVRPGLLSNRLLLYCVPTDHTLQVWRLLGRSKGG